MKFCREVGPRGYRCTKPRDHRRKHAARGSDGQLYARWDQKLPADLPRGFEGWNPAMRGAYLKGRRARRAGDPIDACPYGDRRTWRGSLTWSRAFAAAWRDGWRDEDKTERTDK